MANKHPNKYILETGIGLQDVDHLRNSAYFLSESARYINGEITLDELDSIIETYYQNRPDVDDRMAEADKVSVRMAQVIAEDAFTFSVGQLLTIHRYLFQGVLKHPSELRTYSFSKIEWVLYGASVTYGDFHGLERTLQYDFGQEKKYGYGYRTMDETIEHLAVFVANLWQIHAFEEGNTQTTANFFIKYLRSLGFDVTNDIFSKYSWYFRNALVRANYTNISKGIFEDRTYLIAFLRNLTLGEENELENRFLHVSARKPLRKSRSRQGHCS